MIKLSSSLTTDLHLHSRFSDGELEPEELIDNWIAKGYRQIAITDHDGINGSVKGLEYVRSRGLDIDFITGIEFDSSDELSEEIHILGYGMDFDNRSLRDTLDKVLGWRKERNRRILETLRALGYRIEEQQLWAVNEGRFVGKPTFARVLVDEGYFSSIGDVFDKLLEVNPDIKAIVKHTLSSREVVKLIHESGGAAVMAHPMEQRRKGETAEAFGERLNVLLETLIGYGIDGIECFHPSANEEEARMLKAFAEARGLAVTRGSDFHSVRNQRVY